MTVPLKHPHSLHQTHSPRQVAARLREQLIAEHVITDSTGHPPTAWLLVGSLAEGIGNSTSDIDVLILSDEPGTRIETGSDAIMRSTVGVETLRYLDGLEVNTEMVAWTTVRASARAFLELAPAFY